MTNGPGDTISVVADTLSLPARQTEFSLGRIIPLISPEEVASAEDKGVTGLTSDYVSGFKRAEGEPRPSGPVNSDMSFIVLSLSLLLVSLLTAFGRRSIIAGLSSISFRRHEEIVPAGTSEVFSWPPILRNAFTILNISLFTATALLVPDMAGPVRFQGPVALTAIIAGSFLAALLLRHLLCIALAGITGFKSLFREYMNVVYNSWFASSVILFILNGLILFAKIGNPVPFIISGIVVVSIFLLIRALRLLLIFHDRHVSIFYFILYLCALEVLPVLVILKLLGVY